MKSAAATAAADASTSMVSTTRASKLTGKIFLRRRHVRHDFGAAPPERPEGAVLGRACRAPREPCRRPLSLVRKHSRMSISAMVDERVTCPICGTVVADGGFVSWGLCGSFLSHRTPTYRM